MKNRISSSVEDSIQEYFSRLIFENEELEKVHNPHDQELREFGSIESGDVERLEKSRSEDYVGELGTLSKDPLRNMQYMGVVVITLASRAAIRGGLLPEIALSLSDVYIQKIDECRDIPTIYHILHLAELQYTKMVKELHEQGKQNKEKNPHINKCKDYIFAHLHEKIIVQDMAEVLNLNANYLSELFHKYEGISITSYIQNQKINAVKNLLTYSQYSYIEIATYLGYSSQSHLGKIFKEKTGYTLRQYRNQYSKKEFRK